MRKMAGHVETSEVDAKFVGRRFEKYSTKGGQGVLHGLLLGPGTSGAARGLSECSGGKTLSGFLPAACRRRERSRCKVGERLRNLPSTSPAVRHLFLAGQPRKLRESRDALLIKFKWLPGPELREIVSQRRHVVLQVR